MVKNEKGVTLIEFVAIVLFLIFGITSTFLAGYHYGPWGYLFGFPVAAIIWYAILFVYLMLEGLFLEGIPRIPKCKKGSCTKKQYDYVEISDGKWVWQCKCGDSYVFRKGRRHFFEGRRFVSIDDNGNLSPYLRWISFIGWKPEK